MQTLVIYDGSAKTGWCCDDLRLSQATDITLDLSRLTFVGPLFLVRLRAWLDHHAAQGSRIRVIVPDSPNVQNYLSRMHLVDGLDPAIELDLPSVRENPKGDRLIPLTKLTADGREEFDDLLGEILDSPDMRYAGYLAEVVDETAQEMALNAVWHGNNPIGAYVAAQRFRHPWDRAPHVCVVAVGDMGIGMARHLEQGGQGRESDALTIAHGMTDMVSGTGVYGRGRGYSVPFELARQKGAAEVDLKVRANTAWVEKRNDDPPRRLPATGDACVGTWVEFTFAHSTSPPE